MKVKKMKVKEVKKVKVKVKEVIKSESEERSNLEQNLNRKYEDMG